MIVHIVRPLVQALLGAAALSSASLAQAGPSQWQVNPPGGFASACASDLTAGVSFTPGVDIGSGAGGNPGHFFCQGQFFSGAAGSATAAANWTTASVQNQSSAAVSMGRIGLQANDVAPVNEQFPVGVAGGGWADTMVIDLPGHAGQAAVWRFSMTAQGSLASNPVARASVMLNAYLNQTELMRDVAGFDIGGSDLFATDRQRVAWSSTGSSRTVDDVVTFAVPVILGQSFAWGVYATAMASATSWASAPWVAAAAADFSPGLAYGGSAGLFVGGVAMDDYTLNSASGIDWMQAAPVPEPGSWLLMLAGIGWLARRRIL